MGQRLLLAITLLIVARTVTFISPLPAEPNAGNSQRERISRSPQFAPPLPVAPTNPPLPEQPPVEETENPIPSQEQQDAPTFESAGSSDRNDRNDTNPVHQWAEDPRNQPTETYQASSNSTNPAAACQSVDAAVVTVIPGKGAGSGSIVSREGLVITNNHVVKHLGTRTLYIRTRDGSRYEGQVIATDLQNDLALIRMNAQTSFPTVQFSSDRNPAVGQAVCAIGSPYGQPGVITEGTLRRVFRNGDIQSDLVLKPGNSGGPLLNTQAEMIGVNKRIIRDGEGGVRASFSTSGAIAKEFFEQHRNN